MNLFKSHFGKTFLISSVPLLMSGTFFLLEGSISGLGYDPENQDSIITNKNQLQPHNLEGILRQMRVLSLSAYGSYLHFMIAVFLINLIWELVTLSGRIVSRSKGRVVNSCIVGYQNSKEPLMKQLEIKNLIIFALFYALTYLLIQTTGSLFFSITNLYPISALKTFDSSFHPAEENLFLSPARRLLEEENEEERLFQEMITSELISQQLNPNIVPEKISFSIATTLGSLDLSLSSIVLSKDGTLAFVAVQAFGTLKILNIEDPQYPVEKASLDLIHPLEFYGQKALFLTSDERTLYVSNFKFLEIVDVSDPLLPKLRGCLSMTDLPDKNYGLNNGARQSITTLALSQDKKSLFVGGLGLEIIDVSEATNPRIIFQKLPNENIENATLSSVVLSADGRYLFLANDTLDIYQVSDPKTPKMICSLKLNTTVNSIFLADERKTAYVIGKSKESNELILEQINISNLQAPVTTLKTTLAKGNIFPCFIIGASPNKTQLYIIAENFKDIFSADFSVLVFDLTKNTLISDDQSLINSACSIAISADGKKAFVAMLSQFVVFELFSDYPNSQILSLTKNSIGYSQTKTFWRNIVSSVENKIVYVAAVNPFSAKKWFEIWDITHRSTPRLIISCTNISNFEIMTIAPNYQRAFFFWESRILALDISDVTNLSVFATYEFDGGTFGIQMLASQNSNILYVLMKTRILIIDFSDASYVTEISRIESLHITAESQFEISSDEKTLYLIQSTSSRVYDITNKAKPNPIRNFPTLNNELEILPYSVKFYQDSKTLFIELFEAGRIKKLRIFDVSNSSSITLISETLLSMNEPSLQSIHFQITPDFKTGYFFQQDKMIVLNLTNLTAPTLSGIVPILERTQSETLSNFVLTPDGKLAFSCNSEMELMIIDLQLRYTLFLNQESFSVGNKYSGGVMLFRVANDGKDYTPLNRASFKFLTFSLLDFKITINRAVSDMKFRALPSWIGFDWDNHVLTIDAKRQAEIGYYALYSTSSKKISNDDFLTLECVNGNRTILRDLVTMLKSLGYIDNENFLTSQFGALKSFTLTSQFVEYQIQIYNFLRRSFIETSTRFEVKSSSSLLDTGDKFSLVTPNAANIRIEILLHPEQKEFETKGQFLFKPYASLIPVITEKKSKLKLEGPLDDVNKALEEIVVNYGSDNTWCEGEITFIDNMNPPITRAYKNISKYLQRNGLPKFNPEVILSPQEQIEIIPIETGQYFTISLNKSTFKDDHTEDLSYHLMLAQEPHGLPDGLSFEDLTIQGTPQEQIFGRDLEFVLAVRNEFQTLKIPLRLHVNFSSMFILKLVLTYTPYILTAIGLFISANKVYNIVAQKYYKHRKEFLIEVGEEITPQVFFPVNFIVDEKRESKQILKEMLRGSGKAELLKSFMTEERLLDKQKIVQEAMKVFRDLLNRDKKQSELSRKSSRSVLINKIIIYELIKWQIGSKEEKETRILFNKIKNKWFDIVAWDSNILGFIINPQKFDKVVVDSQNNGAAIARSQDHPQEESLIERNINLQLLKDAVLAYAFEDHNIEESSILVKVDVKQRIESNILFKFLKLDLQDIHLSEKSKLDYGIHNSIKRDTLNFYGIPDEDIEGKTLLVQITNLKKRILKEIWIHCVSKNSVKNGLDVTTESSEIDVPL